MSPITRLFKKSKVFEWTTKCQNAWEEIKNQYVQAHVLISPNWELEFYVHIDASQLIVRVVLDQNPIGKFDQSVMYASKLLKSIKKNYITIEKEALAIVYALHKCSHYLLGNY